MKHSALAPGTLLARRYRIARLIGKGGMGATYQGEDRESGRRVAVKELADLFETSAEREFGITNFLAEMRVLELLHHPQIPRILDHFVEKRGFFFVLEFVEGKDFATVLHERNQAPLPEEEVIRVGVQVCRILDYLHRQFHPPLVHKDIKPGNLMERTADRRIMLLDFGIAKAAKPKAGLMIGTLGYAPPEQHRNQTEPRSDLYSLAVTLFQLSTGAAPEEDSFTFPAPSEIHPGLSQAFSHVILRALRYSPEERYPDAYSFEKALQNLLPEPIPSLAESSFEKASRNFAKTFFLPWLSKVQAEYKNECQTQFNSDLLDYFSLTLQFQLPYTLIIQASPEKFSLSFSVKEGLLSPVVLGEIDPRDRTRWEKAGGFLDQFLQRFRRSKGETLEQR